MEKQNKKREPLTQEEMKRYEGEITELFQRLGMETETPGTKDTPRRWLKALSDMTAGYEVDPKIRTAFPAECKECKDHELEHLTEGPIKFVALCEHHVL